MELDEELILADIPGTTGSILETFSHLLCAEADFLKQIHGTSPQPAFAWDATPILSQMATFATQFSVVFLDTIQHVLS